MNEIERRINAVLRIFKISWGAYASREQLKLGGVLPAESADRK